MCFAPTHVDYLYAQITSRTLAAMIDANDEMYDCSLANLISEPPGTTPNTADADDNGSGAMAKAMPKGPPQPAQPKAQPKAQPNPKAQPKAAKALRGLEARRQLLERIAAMKTGQEGTVNPEAEVEGEGGDIE